MKHWFALIAMIFLGAVLGLQLGCTSTATHPLQIDKLSSVHLDNLIRINEMLYSGAQPKTDVAFKELNRLGFTVIVSVDGATPDVQRAEAHGLQYIHVPIGYDGIPEHAARSFARVARDLDGKIYVHCHHGKHRGPAAAAVLAMETGSCNVRQALTILEKAGTSKKYAGLWRDIRSYTPIPSDAQLPDLVAVAEVESLAAAMAKIDRTYDRLKLCEKAGWSVPTDHPDVVPDQEALIMKEAFRESARLYKGTDKSMKELLRKSESLAQRIEEALEAKDKDKASTAFNEIKNACNDCHVKFRN